MQSYSALELAEMHIESLYELNAEGRIVRIREPAPDPPPRLALNRTRQGNIALVRDDLPEALASALLDLAASEPPLGDPEAPPLYVDAYIEALSEHAPVEQRYAGPNFVLPAGQGLPGGLTRISSENEALLERHYAWAAGHLDAYGPVWSVVEDGAAVAIGHSAREPSRGIEAGVHTIEAYRQRGFARRVVTAWAQEISQLGRLPFYSTWWENTASLLIAARLGGEFYAVDFSVT